MTPNVRRFVEVVAKNISPPEPIVEIGSYIVKGHEHLANLRNFFPGSEYIGCDIRKGPGVDKLENIEKLSFKNESIGTLLILETLEHVQNCIRALEEAYRVLNKDGIVAMSSLMNFQIHDHPEDYWRFTPKAFEYLLRKFPIKIIGAMGDKVDFPTNVFGVGFKNDNHKIAKKLMKSLVAKEGFIRGRKPWGHRLLSGKEHLTTALKEITHSYSLTFYMKED
jgi:hypothetical protein